MHWPPSAAHMNRTPSERVDTRASFQPREASGACWRNSSDVARVTTRIVIKIYHPSGMARRLDVMRRVEIPTRNWRLHALHWPGPKGDDPWR